VVDTANALLLRDACDILLKKIDVLLDVLQRRAMEFKGTPQVGRTHGIHAEPTSFGLVFALWFDEMRRNRERLQKARASVAVGKISGAVVLLRTSILRSRKRFAPGWESKRLPFRRRLFSATTTRSTSAPGHYRFVFGQVRLQIRHWQRTECAKRRRKFKKGQKGSSAMRTSVTRSFPNASAGGAGSAREQHRRT